MDVFEEQEGNDEKAGNEKAAKKDLSFKISHYKHGRQHQAMDYIRHGQMLASLNPALDMSIAPMLLNEVALERELALDKKLHKGGCRAPKAKDDSHLVRAEKLIGNLKTGQERYHLGLSTDRLQSVGSASNIKQGRIYLPSCFNAVGIQPVFEQCVTYVRGLGPEYSQYLAQTDLGWIIATQPMLITCSTFVTHQSQVLIIRGNGTDTSSLFNSELIFFVYI